MQHQESKEEMGIIENNFSKIKSKKVIHKARDGKEDESEKFQQEKREKVKQLSGNPSAIEDPGCRAEEVARFIKSQDEEIKKNFEKER